MIRTAFTAVALFGFALAGAAQAHDPVGGGSATISGGSDDCETIGAARGV